MKKRLSGILLSLALTITSVFSGVMSPIASIETKAAETAPAYRNVMYYGEWSIYAGQNYFYPSKIDGSKITHLNFAFYPIHTSRLRY